MNDTITPVPTAVSRSGKRERAAWWITFAGLTLFIVTMLGLWN